MSRIPAFLAALPFLTCSAPAADVPARLDQCDVIWNTPSGDSAGSMPVGNGDVGLNAWIEKNGDLVFYIGKNDAWSGDLTSPSYGAYGLIKVGKVRVSLTPNPFADGATFRQELKLREGAIEVTAGPDGGKSKMLLWVDANHPVIHVETACANPARIKVSFESYRTTPTQFLGTDIVVPDQKKRIAWYYLNPNRDIPQLVHRTIGASVSGDGLTATSPATLESAAPSKAYHVDVHTLTAQCPEPRQWLAQLDRQIAATNATPLEKARQDHRAWWGAFWNRSWVFVNGDPTADRITQGYVLQRFKNACSSRGEFPIKFNGSIFNVDDPHAQNQMLKDKQGGQFNMPVTADFRSWGYQYWFQNTRPMYWPMMMSGDFDLMKPLFRMYRAMLPGNAARVKELYHHDGAYFRETGPFWGGLEKITPEDPGNYTRHYYTPILELSSMMLDYFAYTGDKEFAKDTLLPMADAGVTFFDKHFSRDPQGKLLLEPDNAIEMFWKTRNPLPDIAGLRFVLQGLLALPPDLTGAGDRQRWQRLLASVPPVPVGTRDGQTRILPFEDGQNPPRHNSENPELYAIYPFRIYGLGKPDIGIARAAFDARKYKTAGCWSQDAVQAALLGDVETARKSVITHLTRKEKRLRFPAFWSKGHDYVPDEDNGGNGLLALQHMLLQADGKRILLLPAWPKDWDADFKLHAPMQTTIEGTVRQGKLVNLQVTPAARRADVTVMGEAGQK